MSIDLEHAQTIAIEAAHIAGKVISEAFYLQKQIEVKDGNETNMVTETDKKSEEVIIAHLLAAFPSSRVISEETNDKVELTEEPTWIIDPIDGTTNFVHSFPLIAVSIGLCIDKQPVLGVIYNPILDYLYTAIKGKGAWLNRTYRLHVSGVQTVNKALVSGNFPYSRTHETLAHVFEYFGCLLRNMVHGIRTSGSAVINLAYVAYGALEAYAEEGVYAWDVCAGKVLVEEAGGVVTDLDCSQQLDLFNHRILATNNKAISEAISKEWVRIDSKHRLYDLITKLVKWVGENAVISTSTVEAEARIESC